MNIPTVDQAPNLAVPPPTSTEPSDPKELSDGMHVTQQITMDWPSEAPVPPPDEPPRPRSSVTKDLAVALAQWIFEGMRDRGVDQSGAHAAAVAAMRESRPIAVRAARDLLGPIPVPTRQVIRHYANLRARLQLARTSRPQDEYSPEKRHVRFRRLRAIRVLTSIPEHHEMRSVRAPCPICRRVTPQLLELSLPYYLAIACLRCSKTRRGGEVGYGPPPFLLRRMAGNTGMMTPDLDGAVRIMASIIDDDS